MASLASTRVSALAWAASSRSSLPQLTQPPLGGDLPGGGGAHVKRVVAIFLGIAQFWRQRLRFQQGPEQHVGVKRQHHVPQRSRSWWKGAQKTCPPRGPVEIRAGGAGWGQHDGVTGGPGTGTPWEDDMVWSGWSGRANQQHPGRSKWKEAMNGSGETDSSTSPAISSNGFARRMPYDMPILTRFSRTMAPLGRRAPIVASGVAIGFFLSSGEESDAAGIWLRSLQAVAEQEELRPCRCRTGPSLIGPAGVRRSGRPGPPAWLPPPAPCRW